MHGQEARRILSMVLPRVFHRKSPPESVSIKLREPRAKCVFSLFQLQFFRIQRQMFSDKSSFSTFFWAAGLHGSPLMPLKSPAHLEVAEPKLVVRFTGVPPTVAALVSNVCVCFMIYCRLRHGSGRSVFVMVRGLQAASFVLCSGVRCV